MLKYIKSCYSYVCEMISNRFEYVYGVNKNQLEQENNYYCKMTDGGFVIKKVEEPTVPPTWGPADPGRAPKAHMTPSLLPTPFYLRGTARQTPSQKGGVSEAVST
jgi:hypothetical protein